MINGKQTKFFAVGIVLALGVSYLMLTGMSATTVYYLTVAELKALGADALGQQVRVNGTVAQGSIVRHQAGLELHFTVEDESGQLPVVYSGGPVPDIFSEHVEVVVEGHLNGDGTFEANTLLAKCPSRFEDGSQIAATAA